ncbi:unnamed protein product [Toxocara canis]|uniref:DUF190 domain-containing protein n=1 Tax=Toxocara canis TaxID=6265 RepID=A0A183UMW4_TOXCA|nr:unnamed protein product [Toxocara canis]
MLKQVGMLRAYEPRVRHHTGQFRSIVRCVGADAAAGARFSVVVNVLGRRPHILSRHCPHYSGGGMAMIGRWAQQQ